jgi:hypothetical protein
VFELGHGGKGTELVPRQPRLVEALAGKKVVGTGASYNHTAVWTDEGMATSGRGHGAHDAHTVACTEAGGSHAGANHSHTDRRSQSQQLGPPHPRAHA